VLIKSEYIYLLSLNSVRKERPKQSMKEEQLKKKKKTMLATVIGVAIFNALISHGYNRS
jgi:hypothetical protein